MKILLVDPETIYSDGLKINLERVGFSCTAVPSFDRCKSGDYTSYDLWIIDPDAAGFDTARSISYLKSVPPRVLFYSHHFRPELNMLAKEHQFSGFMMKNASPDQWKLIVDEALKGVPHFTITPFSHSKKLTDRQMEVLSFLSAGCSNKEIAHRMSLSEATVKLHMNALLRNLKVTNRTQAVVKAQQLGFVPPVKISF